MIWVGCCLLVISLVILWVWLLLVILITFGFVVMVFCCFRCLVGLSLLCCIYGGRPMGVWLRMGFAVWRVCGVAFVLGLTTVSVFNSCGFLCCLYCLWILVYFGWVWLIIMWVDVWLVLFLVVGGWLIVVWFRFPIWLIVIRVADGCCLCFGIAGCWYCLIVNSVVYFCFFMFF